VRLRAARPGILRDRRVGSLLAIQPADRGPDLALHLRGQQKQREQDDPPGSARGRKAHPGIDAEGQGQGGQGGEQAVDLCCLAHHGIGRQHCSYEFQHDPAERAMDAKGQDRNVGHGGTAKQKDEEAHGAFLRCLLHASPQRVSAGEQQERQDPAQVDVALEPLGRPLPEPAPGRGEQLHLGQATATADAGGREVAVPQGAIQHDQDQEDHDRCQGLEHGAPTAAQGRRTAQPG